MPPVIEKKREEFLKKEGAFAPLRSLCERTSVAVQSLASGVAEEPVH